jgi:hypothetical protein
VAPGEISPTTNASPVANTEAMKMGSIRRWKLFPPALAAVSSECRPMAPTVKTVANNTAAGMTRNAFSGIEYT